MTKKFQKDLPSSDLKSVLAEGKRLKDLTPTTKDWIRGRLLEDTSVKPINKVEKAADSMTKTGGGLINWAKNNPVQAALLIVPGAFGFRLASKAGTFIAKKYGPKAADKVKDTFAKKMAPDFKVSKKESVISKTVKKNDEKKPPIQNSGVDKIVKKKTPPIQRSGVDKLNLAKQKVNNSKQIKNLNLSFDDKKKVINQIAKDDNKTLTNALAQVLKKNGKTKSIISKPVKVDKTKPDTTNKKTFERMREIIEERKKPEYTAKMTKIKKEQEKTFARNEKRRRDKITAKRNQTIKNKKEDEAKKLAKTQTGPKLTSLQKLYKEFKNKPEGISKAIDKLDISPPEKSRLRQEVVSYKPSLKEITELGLKKGGLIKRNMGGNLKQPPAGNKGLRKLPTPVRNKMGFAKRGGVVKKSTGGFLGAGKALRGQGAVMKKRGGKIGY